jgi:hypothetical protein
MASLTDLLAKDTAGTTVLVSLHTGDPGTTGANEVTRVAHATGPGAYQRRATAWTDAITGRVGAATPVTFNVPSGTTVTHWGMRTGDGDFIPGGMLATAYTGPGTYTLTPTVMAGNAAIDALVPLRAALDAGTSAVMQVLSDSTGTDTDEWFGVFGSLLGEQYAAHGVRFMAWDDVNLTLLNPWATAAIKTPPAGERALRLNGVNGAFHERPASGAYNTGDLQVTFYAVPSGGWASGTAVVLVADYAASGTERTWFLRCDADGTLRFQWSADGTNLQTAATSSVVVPAAALAVRVTLDVDAGATNHTITFATSLDRVTFTTLGTVTTRAGSTTSINTTGTQAIRLGYYSGFAGVFNGDVHGIEVRRGDLKANLVRFLPEQWETTDNGADTPLPVGSPLLLCIAAAASGQDAAYWTTHVDKAFTEQGQSVLFVSTNHNETLDGYRFRATYATLLDLLRTKLPYTPFVCLNQNPKNAVVHDAAEIREHTRRGLALLQVAALKPGCTPLDIYPAFAGVPGGAVEPADGTHPTRGIDGGSGLWAKRVLGAFNAWALGQ